MAYTSTPKMAFMLAPSKKGTFKYSEIEIDWSDWTSFKRCMDIKLFLDHHVAMADDHTSFHSTKDYLNWIFSRKSPFAQKLMVTLLVRENSSFRPKTKSKSGISHGYQILHDVFTQFSADVELALESGKFSKKLESYKEAHFRRNDKLWIREIKKAIKEKREKKPQPTQQAIDCTFSPSDEVIYNELSDYWKRTLGTYRIMFFNELKGKKPFVYQDTGNRRTHPIQGLKREAQALIFRNTPYVNDHDWKCCALSALISLNERELGIDVESAYPTLFDYMENKKEYRKKYAELFQLDEQKGKKLFAHLINKGIISKSSFCSWKKLIEDDMRSSKTRAARKDEWLMSFYEEVKLMWSHCIKSASKMYDEGRLDFKVTNKNRFDLYFRLERQIMDVCTDFLDKKGINYFLIHDGFRTDKKFSGQELEQELFNKLHLVMELENNYSNTPNKL